MTKFMGRNPSQIKTCVFVYGISVVGIGTNSSYVSVALNKNKGNKRIIKQKNISLQEKINKFGSKTHILWKLEYQ